eukprot:gene5715-5780_t
MEPVMVLGLAKTRRAGMAIMKPPEAAVEPITATTGFFAATLAIASCNALEGCTPPPGLEIATISALALSSFSNPRRAEMARVVSLISPFTESRAMWLRGRPGATTSGA